MAKRLGANSRKRNAANKIKAKNTARKIAGRLVIIISVCAIGALLAIAGLRGALQVVTSVKQSKAFSITAINIEGNNHVDGKTILDKCGFTDTSKTYSIRESSVQNALLDNPWIESVKVVKGLGGKIKIKINERKPIALVNMRKIYYIDKNGVLFPMASKVISDMPLLCGLKDTVDRHGIRKVSHADMVRVNRFLNEALAVNDEFFQSITQIDFSKRESVCLSVQASSAMVELSENNLDVKLRQLIELEDELQKNSSVPEKIDMSYQNLAFVTVRDPFVEAASSIGQ